MKINVNRHIIFWLALIAPFIALAQKNYVVTQYSTQDGLPQKTINTIQEDHNGNMWFATWNGISRFNGHSFTNYKLHPTDSIDFTSNRFSVLKENKDGFFWMMNYNKYVYRFNPHNGMFQQIPCDSKYKAETLNILSNGDVWVHMENGDLYRIYSHDKSLIKVQKIIHLSSSIKSLFLKDDNVWILTDNELLQYQTDSHKIIRRISGKDIQQLYHLRKYYDHFLIAADSGYLYNYNLKKNSLTSQKLPTDSYIRNLKAFSPTQILVITISDGFFIYNLEDKSSVHYTTQTAGLIDNSIKNLYVDENKDIWATYNYRLHNVSHLNPQSGKISHYVLKNRDGKDVDQCNTIRIIDDIHNTLLFYSSGNILNYYDKENDRLAPFILSENPDIISFNEPTTIYLDKQKNMWLGKQNRGVIKVSFKKELFKLTSPNPNDLYSAENELQTVFEDKDKNLWAGTQEGAILLYDKGKRFIGYLSPSGNISSQKAFIGMAHSIIQDKQGTIWIATKDRGIITLTPQSRYAYQLKYYSNNPNDPYSLNCNQVYDLHEDSNGRIWVGTFECGLNYVEKRPDGKIVFINSNNELKQYPPTGEQVRCLQADNEGNLWIGTLAGIVQCNVNFTQPSELKFQTIAHVAGNPNSLGYNDIYDIHLTHDNQLYFATYGGGLCRLKSFQSPKAVFKNYTKADGLPSDVLQTIQEDADGYLWIATEEGLCKFFPQDETFETYDSRFFPSDIQFTEGYAIRRSSDELIFNTDRGFLSFQPKLVKKDSYKPRIVYNHLRIKENEMAAGKGPLKNTNIDEASSLTLSHDENSFTIGYVALDMKYPDKIQYAYKLDGFDNWNYVGSDQTATYTNIPKGEYTFRVKSTNSDGLWVENEKAIRITIQPSFWESGWGILLLIVLFASAISVTSYIVLLFYKLKSKVVFEQRLSDVKTKFFTDIVHELRTPFTLIVAPLEHILSTKELPETVHQDLKLMQRNTQRTVKLINQILDFQKIQNHKMKLRVQRIELYAYIQHITERFESLAANQETEIVLHSTSREIYLWIDADKMETVLFNLISNAFKYSPKGKSITIDIREEDESVSISVSDQGYGIAPEKQKLIFSRFENLVNNQILKQPSTGIGLSLVKEIVELHKGTIELQSRVNEGSTFQIKLLKGKEHFEKDTEFILTDYQFDEAYENTLLDESDTINEENELKDDLQTLLLVEDNNELRHFLRTILSEHFQIVTASNGEEGLQKTLQFSPDMIISDVVMPVMDGIEMVKKIRTNIAICHIPIILLTSKSTIENRIEGLKLGIEDYITKPFSANHLKARIFNLLEQRKRLQALYCSQLISSSKEKGKQDTDPEELTLLSAFDKELINKEVEFIKKNIENATLTVENIAKEVGISRSALLKKTKILTGLSPIELIKNIRIQQAIVYMEEGKQSLTQIAYATGFTDSHYFSNCFKQMYGMTPREYQKKYLQK